MGTWLQFTGLSYKTKQGFETVQTQKGVATDSPLPCVGLGEKTGDRNSCPRPLLGVQREGVSSEAGGEVVMTYAT